MCACAHTSKHSVCETVTETYLFFPFPMCVCFVVCVSRICGGGSVRQCEAKPEGIHQENSVPGQQAADSDGDLQPRQRWTSVPWDQGLSAGQSVTPQCQAVKWSLFPRHTFDQWEDIIEGDTSSSVRLHLSTLLIWLKCQRFYRTSVYQSTSLFCL